MPEQHYDFYLGSREHRDEWAIPRSCSIKGRLAGPYGEEYLLLEVTPPVVGQGYGLGGEDIYQLIISPHHEGDSMSAVTKHPIPVYVYRILDRSMLGTRKFRKKDVELVAWAELYPTLQEAQQASSMPR